MEEVSVQCMLRKNCFRNAAESPGNWIIFFLEYHGKSLILVFKIQWEPLKRLRKYGNFTSNSVTLFNKVSLKTLFSTCSYIDDFSSED